jgi:alpha/beta superfamily hydrolase
MRRESLQGKNDYKIPCISYLNKNNEKVVIISHGLGSSKESPTAKAVSSALIDLGIGTIAFDFPAHGDSPVDGEYFSIKNCLDDLAIVESYVNEQLPDAQISYFSSSFGAYINLIHLATRPHLGIKSFLRCAAVDLPGIFRKETTPEIENQLNTQGYIVLDKNYHRPLKITKQFCEDLEKHDLFELYKPSNTELLMIHGNEDETASVLDARRFSKQFGIKLIEVKGADHQFKIPGGMKQVIDTAIEFLLK